MVHDRIPALKRSLDLWSKLMSAAEDTPFASLLGQGKPIAIGWEQMKWFFGRSEHTLPAIGLANIERLPFVKGGDPARLFEEVRALRQEIEDRIGPDGVLLYPSYTRTAPRHGRPLFTPIDWVYTAVFNVLELPVTQVPLGLDAKGLPLGVQVAGCHGVITSRSPPLSLLRLSWAAGYLPGWSAAHEDRLDRRWWFLGTSDLRRMAGSRCCA